MENSDYVDITKKWIEKVVLGLQLCPFASQPFHGNKINYIVNQETDLLPITNDITEEAQVLSSGFVETSFIILPQIDLIFEEFYSLVRDLQDLLDRDLKNDIVLVVFHPEFRYADNNPEETANATNKSPYPMIHLLKGESLDVSGNSDIDIEELLANNKSKLESMSWSQINDLYK